VTTCATSQQPKGQTKPEAQQHRQSLRSSCDTRKHVTTTTKQKTNTQRNSLSQQLHPETKPKNTQNQKPSNLHSAQEDVVYKGLFTTTNREKTTHTITPCVWFFAET
jgi:hypothetical protein